MSSQPAPGPPRKPPRSALRVRDLLLALAVLVPVMLMVGGISRACSFAPAGPTVDPRGLPVVDAPAELRELAPRVPFALRVPAVPPTWRSNSVGQDLVPGGGRAVRTGFLTSEGRYLRLLQSDAVTEALLAVEVGTNPVAAGSPVDVGGQRWIGYSRNAAETGSGNRAEPLWIAEVGGQAPVRLLITGSGSDEEFRTLAAAVLAGEVLPVGVAPR